MSRSAGRPEDATGSAAALDRLESRVEALLAERQRLEAEVARLSREREEFRSRLDAILADVDAAVIAVSGA